MEENIISAHEAADILGTTQRAVTALLKRGALVGKKLGREWAIDKASVLYFKAKKRTRKGSKGE